VNLGLARGAAMLSGSGALLLSTGGCSDAPGEAALRLCREWVSANLGYRSDFDAKLERSTRLEELTIVRIDFEGRNTYDAQVDGMALCAFDRTDDGVRLRPELSSITESARNARPLATRGED